MGKEKTVKTFWDGERPEAMRFVTPETLNLVNSNTTNQIIGFVRAEIRRLKMDHNINAEYVVTNYNTQNSMIYNADSLYYNNMQNPSGIQLYGLTLIADPNLQDGEVKVK